MRIRSADNRPGKKSFRKWFFAASICATALFLFSLPYFANVNLVARDGGSYLNDRYGFTFAFPGHWQNQYIVEEGFDKIYVRNKKIAHKYGANQGTLFIIAATRKTAPPKATANLLGETANHSFACVIPPPDTEAFAHDAALVAEYRAMCADLPSILADTGRFQAIKISPDPFIVKSFAPEILKDIGQYRDTDIGNKAAIQTLCDKLPLGTFLMQVETETTPKGNSITLSYEANATRNLHIQTIGSIGKLTATLLFTLVDRLDYLVISFEGMEQIGYGRALFTDRGYSFSRLKKRLATEPEEWLSAARYPPAGEQERELGKVDRTAIATIPGKAPVFSEARENAPVVLEIEKNSLLRVLAEAGDYYYVEYPFENSCPAGYIARNSLSLDAQDFDSANQGYLNGSAVYSHPTEGKEPLFASRYDPFTLLEKKGPWLHCKFGDGQSGWVQKDDAVFFELPPLYITLGRSSFVELYGKALVDAFEQDQNVNRHVRHIVINETSFPNLPVDYKTGIAGYISEAVGLPADFSDYPTLMANKILQVKDDICFFSGGVFLTVETDGTKITAEHALFKIRKFYSTNNTIWIENLFKKTQNQTWDLERSFVVQTT